MNLPKNFIRAGENYCSIEKNVPAPYFRKAFKIRNIKSVNLCGNQGYSGYHQ